MTIGEGTIPEHMTTAYTQGFKDILVAKLQEKFPESGKEIGVLISIDCKEKQRVFLVHLFRRSADPETVKNRKTFVQYDSSIDPVIFPIAELEICFKQAVKENTNTEQNFELRVSLKQKKPEPKTPNSQTSIKSTSPP